MKKKNKKYYLTYTHVRGDMFPELLALITGLDNLPKNCNAITRCFIKKCEDQTVVASGEAYCSKKDQYCKKTGRDIARERAWRSLKQKILTDKFKQQKLNMLKL